MGINFEPNYYINVTHHFSAKKKAILSHKSQNPERFIDLCTLMNSCKTAEYNLPKGFYEAILQQIISFFRYKRNLPLSPKLRPFYIENKNSSLKELII